MFSLQAQDTTEGSIKEKLSLTDAIEQGLANNFDIRIEQSRVEDATQLNSWGQAGRFPTLSFQASSNNSSTFNQPANPFALPGTTQNYRVSGRANVQWVIFNGMRVNITKEQLEKMEAQSEMQAAITMENTVEQIVSAYYNAKLQQENLKVFETILKLSKDRVELVRLQKDLGSGSSFEVSQEETRFFNDSTNYVNQELQVANAFRDLNELLSNEDLEKVYALTDPLEIEPTAFVYDDLLQKMRASNSNLQRQYRALELSAINIRLQKTRKVPNIVTDFGLDASNTWFTADFPSGDGTTERDTRRGYNYGPYGNLTVSVPIFNGTQNNRAIQSAKLALEQQQLNTDKLELSLANQLKKAHEQYLNRIELVDLTQRSLDAAELNLRLSQEQLDLGTISSFDYRIVQNTYLDAAFRSLLAKYNLIQTNARLLRLTGGIIE